ncbi:MAG: DUF1127 domain-containing protein [Pseudomonadota bacterium]
MGIKTKKPTDLFNPGDTDFLSLLLHFQSNAINALGTWKTDHETRKRDRRAIAKLQSLNDANLQDIGITRDDVDWANSLPEEQSATAQLQKIVRKDTAKL